ncbi:MAG: hypothetical protein QOC94_813 [Actinoplanes sp.]|nr:hypothetical protein [Actinoplanes sp.]
MHRGEGPIKAIASRPGIAARYVPAAEPATVRLNVPESPAEPR